MLRENSKKKRAVIIIAMFALGIIFIIAVAFDVSTRKKK